LLGNSAIDFIVDPDSLEETGTKYSGQMIPRRFILTEKQGEIGDPTKAKARWIVLGHKDPDRLKVERFAPTPATPILMLLLQTMSTIDYCLRSE
jgi:hypothetical protein